MPSLLDLPREIRDAIIEHALTTPLPAPPDVAKALENRSDFSRSEDMQFTHLPAEQGYVRFQKAGPPTAGHSLLLGNRQLSAETRSAIERLSTEPPNYTMDLIIADEYNQLWPTWTSIPVLADKVNRVDVTIRFFVKRPDPRVPKPETDEDKRKKRRMRARRLLRGGDGGPPTIVWAHYHLLKHFLEHGATRARNAPPRKTTVRNLHLNFVESGQARREDREHMNNIDRRSEDMIDPENLEHYLLNPMMFLLALGRHTAEYGQMMYQTIGKITTSVRGEHHREIDLGKILYYKGQNPASNLSWCFDTAEKFLTWKREVMEQRKQLGLTFYDKDSPPE